MLNRIKLKYLVLAVAAALTLKLSGILSHLFEKDFYDEFHYPYDGDVHESVAQLRHGVKPDITPINWYNYTFIKSCDHKCKNSDELLKPRLVYIVKSAVGNFERRKAIRNTWGFEHRFSDVLIRTVFVLGQNDPDLQRELELESEKYRDVVQADFYDTYFNNTIKTMIGFKWAVTFCPDSQFYMFVDDDMYVSTKNVLRFVRNPTNYPGYLKQPVFSLKRPKRQQDLKQLADVRLLRSKRQLDFELPHDVRLLRSKRQLDFELPDDVRLLSGYVFISSPHRHVTSKWQVSLEEYPYHMWPPYVTAGSYILSREVLHELYYTSFYTKHFRFDDIYLGLIALKANIEPYHSEEFHFYKLPYSILGYQYVISSHGYDDPEELSQIWNEQRSAGNA